MLECGDAWPRWSKHSARDDVQTLTRTGYGTPIRRLYPSSMDTFDCKPVQSMDMGTPKRAIVYTRVSTDKQVESGISLDDQIERTIQAAEMRGWTVTERMSDEGKSGRKLSSRPGLRAALDALDSGEADVLVCASVDRLARSVIDLGQIMRRADANGWDLVILELGVDTGTPAGRLVVNIMSSLAQFESERIAERAVMTHRQRKARGLRAGRAVELDDDVRERIVEERAEGRSLRAIADDLNFEGVHTARGGRWHASTVKHVVDSVALDVELADRAARRAAAA